MTRRAFITPPGRRGGVAARGAGAAANDAGGRLLNGGAAEIAATRGRVPQGLQ